MNAITVIDLSVLIAYLLGITGLGFWVARRVSNSNDFFMPRRFGKLMMVTHAFGTGTASDQAVIVAGQTFKSGLSGIWWQWIWLPATPFYWVIAAIMRRFRAVTTADVYELRYGRSVASLFALIGIIGLSVKIGLLLKGSGALVDSCTAGLIDANWAIAIITVLFVTYGSAGGLGAAIVTDFAQGILTLVFSFLLLPFMLSEVGGLTGIRESIKNPDMLSLISPGEIGVFFIVMYSVQALVGIVAQPFIMGVCGSGRTELDGRVGFMLGNIAKRICTIAWSLTAIGAVAWYINRGINLSEVEPDYVYGEVAREFLPGMLPGLLGLFLASLLASVMSSCDSFMISSAGLFTENLYKPVFANRSEAHYLWIGRVASLFVVIGGVLFAYWVPNVRDALSIWFKIAPMMGIAFWLGLFWRKATAAGAWAASIAGFLAWWSSGQSWFVDWLSRLRIPESINFLVLNADGENVIYEPWVILFYSLASIMAGVVVSLVTKPIPEERLDRFFSLIYTPVNSNEVLEKPCTLPKGVQAKPRRMLVEFAGLQIPAPSSTSILGFIGGWVAVCAVVGSFVFLLR